ncbi:MAG: acetate--CoA ligase family protein [Syntrophorhabdaceae bacterium]|nr:acetate--CoA ligase family protein [Syntrophorhabdaceae bacterium]
MDRFFNPKSIVVFGVSEAPRNLGRIITGNLERFGYKGNIYAIGPSGGLDGERKIFTGIKDIEEVPELAVILVPASQVPSILEECGKKGITHAIIESGGFTEFSSDRDALERQIIAVARKYNMSIIGPNCFGVVNIDKGVVLPFFILSPDYMRSGNISLISQSGGIFYDTCMISSCENLGLAKVISIGNKLATDENTCLEYLINDPDTKVIGIYLEHFTDGRRFMEIASSTEKPIVLLKANTGESSREIARFHTAALAGDEDVARSAMAQAGVIMVKSFHEMVDCLKAFSLESLKGDRLAVISRSGGHSVLAADSVDRYGFRFARYSHSFLDFVKSKKINVIRATNPLDVGDVYDLSLYSEILEEALKEDDVDGIVFIVTYSSETDGVKVKGFIRDVAKLSKVYKKPVSLSVITNKDEWFPTREATDLPLFSDCDRAIWALSKSIEHHRLLARRSPDRYVKAPTKSKSDDLQRLPAGYVPPAIVFEMLGRYGLPVAEYMTAEDMDEAISCASKIGFPVVLKDGSTEVLHKTEKKGVILDIGNQDEFINRIKQMDAKRYLIQKMYPSGVEVIVGVKYDSSFGHAILVGLGGIFTELIKDRSMRVMPIDEDDAMEMIGGLKGSAIFKGFRGAPPLDIDSLIKIITGISRMVQDNPSIKELDLNPVIVYKKGEGAIIVDAKMRT